MDKQTAPEGKNEEHLSYKDHNESEMISIVVSCLMAV